MGKQSITNADGNTIKVRKLKRQTGAIHREILARWDFLWKQRLRAESVLAEHHDELFRRPEVTGVHIGLRRNFETKLVRFPLQYCIRIHVRPSVYHESRDRFPSDWDGVRIDVLQRIYRPVAGPTDRVEPLIGGIAIANRMDRDNWGTLGMTVSKGGERVFLTNEHVAGKFSQDGKTLGISKRKVIQPPKGGDPSAPDALIGHVTGSHRDQFIDAAIVTPSGKRKRAAGILSIGYDLGLRTLTASDEKFTEAFIVGAASGSTPRKMGVVKNVNTDIQVDGFGWMSNQIVVESPTGLDLIDGGDSGSILLVKPHSNRDHYLAVGLVHAEAVVSDSRNVSLPGTNTIDKYRAIVACHLHRVFDQLGLSLTSLG